MHEILFKAKILATGEWVEGWLCQNLIYQMCIQPNDKSIWYVIDPETICQYTGLTDKDGNMIWENDIVDIDYYATKPHVVKYNYGSFYVGMNGLISHYNKVTKVIGNIFDNPELLKGGA